MENSTTHEKLFSNRINQVPRSFIRDILKVAAAPDMLSFAGGLPNPNLFPVKEIKKSTMQVLDNNPTIALQYGLTQGMPELKAGIAKMYALKGISVPIDQIMITSGSQQALDLIGKTFINRHDHICIEEPSYLGAIQAFSMYSNNFTTCPLEKDGINSQRFEECLSTKKPKLSYLIPNFQNPTGISYSLAKRKKVAQTIINNNSLLIEDDPYGRIKFTADEMPNIYQLAPNNTILLGSFSKILAPGFRLGWIIAPKNLINKLEIAKQASDLHTNAFCQAIAHNYLENNDVEDHVSKISKAYSFQAEAICNAMHQYFPSETDYVIPKGGMFTWVTLPEEISSLNLFEKAKKKKIAFVPGVPFYINKTDTNNMRLNYSCLDPKRIEYGIKTLSKLI